MEFIDVAGDALEETRQKMQRYWKDPAPHMEAVNFALGLFSGIVMRRLRGDPDPDAPQEGADSEAK